jgi:hypothetical protein
MTSDKVCFLLNQAARNISSMALAGALSTNFTPTSPEARNIHAEIHSCP